MGDGARLKPSPAVSRSVVDGEEKDGRLRALLEKVECCMEALVALQNGDQAKAIAVEEGEKKTSKRRSIFQRY